MSINSSIIPDLNQKFNMKLRPTNFKKKYIGSESISSIGSWAFLIASNDVPSSAILEFLQLLDQSKDKLGKSNSSDETLYQLEEFYFYETFQREYDSYWVDLARNSFIFVISLAATTTITLIFLSWVSSGIENVLFYRKIMNIYHNYLPENKNLDDGSGPIPKPIIHPNQTVIISNLVYGLSGLLQLSADVRQAYDDGRMTMGNYANLLSSVSNMKEIFQRNLAQRLNEYFLSGNQIDAEMLRHFYTAGYLDCDDFRYLQTVLKVPSTSPARRKSK